MKQELENKLDELARRYFGDSSEKEKEDIWKPKFDLKKPPGLVGDVTEYINSQCRFPLENLSVLSALVAKKRAKPRLNPQKKRLKSGKKPLKKSTTQSPML